MEYPMLCGNCKKPFIGRSKLSRYCSHVCNVSVQIRVKKSKTILNRETKSFVISLPNEVWLPIVGYEGYYEVSNLGRVKSVERFIIYPLGRSQLIREKLLSPSLSEGYRVVSLCRNGTPNRWFVHRLVATAFLDNPKGKTQVNHIDFNKSNNNVSNLEWCTPNENTQHSVKHKRHSHGNMSISSKQNAETVKEIRYIYKRKICTVRELADIYKYSAKESIYSIISGRTWKHI